MRHTGLSITSFLCLSFLTMPITAQERPATSTAMPAASAASGEKPRVFITDSESWETRGSGGGSNGNWGAEMHGGARPQTAEIIKTFGQRCPEVVINNKQSIADYIVVLDHEGGKGVLRHRNKVAVFEKLSGDVVMSHSTLSLGSSVQDACEEIVKHWGQHGTDLRAAATKDSAVLTPVSASQTPTTIATTTVPKIMVGSSPDGADIEIDGSFVGNTPSSIEVTAGEHQVVIKKSGYKEWSRNLKVSGGEIKLNAELEK